MNTLGFIIDVFHRPLIWMKFAGDSLIARLAYLKIGYLILLVFAVCSSLQAQTYEITPPAGRPRSRHRPRRPRLPAAPAKVAPAPTQGESLGWGSNIQDARIARAAELALKQGNHGLAVQHSQRAAQPAPNDAQIWILLGYAARLNRQYRAFRRCLQPRPSPEAGIGTGRHVRPGADLQHHGQNGRRHASAEGSDRGRSQAYRRFAAAG